MILRDTPPSSPQMEDEIDEDEMVYVGDADEVLEALEGEGDDSENETQEEERSTHDNTVCIFSGHEGSVFCGSLNKDGTLAVTGGEDDKAFIWDAFTGQKILECKGHTDSIIFTEFSHDGSYLAVADMSGLLQAWKLSNKQLIWDYTVGDLTWMRWHSAANVLFGGTATGEVYMWKIPGGECKIFQSHGHRVEHGVLMPDGKRIAVGYEDGTLKLIDLKSGAVLSTVSSDFGHNSTITALDRHSDNILIMSGCVNGKTILSVSQTGKVIGVLQDLKDETTWALEAPTAAADDDDDDDDEKAKGNWVEAVAFCNDPEYQVAATGTVNGQIFIWDIAKQVSRHMFQQNNGVSKLVWYLKTSLLYSAGLDGGVRCFDARSGQQLHSYTAHTADILDLHISSNGKIMLTTSDDATARVLKIEHENCKSEGD